jgi:hypothetical protein
MRCSLRIGRLERHALTIGSNGEMSIDQHAGKNWLASAQIQVGRP